MRQPAGELREAHGPTVREARTAGGLWPRLRLGLLVAALAGTFLAAAGAFGTGAAPIGPRLVFWVGGMGIGSVVGTVMASHLVQRPKVGDSPVRLWLAVTLGVTLIITGATWGLAQLTFGPGRTGSPFGFAMVALAISGIMTAIMMLALRPGPATTASPAGAPAAPAPRLAARLPPALRAAPLYAVEAEDHYLRVRTAAGSELILLRLSDAIAELDGVEGAQVHRSWWVARDGVAGVERTGGRVLLALKDGARAPVSRPNVRPLKEAGWFDGP